PPGDFLMALTYRRRKKRACDRTGLLGERGERPATLNHNFRQRRAVVAGQHRIIFCGEDALRCNRAAHRWAQKFRWGCPGQNAKGRLAGSEYSALSTRSR